MYSKKSHIKISKNWSSRKRIEQVIADVLVRASRNNSGPVTIAVGGPGGTGKSTFTKRLAKNLGAQSAVLRLDDYKAPRPVRKRAGIYGPHPKANKMSLISRHLKYIKNRQGFRKPVYDAKKGSAGSFEKYSVARFNIIDGEVSTYREFRKYVDFSIFIDSDWHTQLATRLGRDIAKRNYTPEKAVATFLHSNLREFSAYGSESKKWADIHLYCHDDYRLEIESVSKELFGHFESILHHSIENLEISGLIVPILTPFKENGGVDLEVFAAHLDWLAASGVRRVLVGGTTGEFFSLSFEERIDLLKIALEYFQGLVLFNASGSSLDETIRFANKAEKLGADGITCLTPYYFANAPEEGLINYFQAVSDAVNIPLIFYNFPTHTGNSVTTGLLKSVKHFGVKDSVGDKRLLKASDRYFTGRDSEIISVYRAGGKGFLSGLANVRPELYVAMEKALAKSKYSDAKIIYKKIERARGSLRGLKGISSLKRLLSGCCKWYPVNVRLPLLSVQEKKHGSTKRKAKKVQKRRK